MVTKSRMIPTKRSLMQLVSSTPKGLGVLRNGDRGPCPKASNLRKSCSSDHGPSAIVQRSTHGQHMVCFSDLDIQHMVLGPSLFSIGITTSLDAPGDAGPWADRALLSATRPRWRATRRGERERPRLWRFRTGLALKETVALSY